MIPVLVPLPPGDPRRVADEFTIDLEGCARCNGDGHPGLTFRKLQRPVELPPLFVLTHWASCPETGEPIMLRVLEAALTPAFES